MSLSDSQPDILNVSETAQFLRVSTGTVRLWVHLRRLPHLKLGSRVLFRRADLERMIAASLRCGVPNSLARKRAAAETHA